jgi:4-hydroxy-2-oxoheptanedioate aldolase
MSRFKLAIANGEVPLQAWLMNPLPLSAEIAAAAGYESVGIDLQHGAIDLQELDALLAVLAANGATPMVRVPTNDRGWVTRVLDRGARGVICPEVDTPEQAAAFAAACKYPPLGTRGFGPVRPAIGRSAGYADGDDGYSPAAENETVLAIAQIESRTGLENVEAIIATKGIDAVMPGPLDFTLSVHGELIADFADRRLREPMEAIVAAAHDAGKLAGLPAFTPESVGLLLEIGVDWIQIGNDVAWITAGARESAAAAREAMAEHRPTG